MLSEIVCDCFHQKKIKFHQGLNVILGTNEGDNSIGKTTLLLIIDFVFGGSTYLNCKDVFENVGDHEIKFKFVFEKGYYFLRSTKEKNVWKCDSEYNKIETILLEDFTKWLDERYSIQLPDLSFRQCVSGFMRIYGKDNYDEHLPLKSFNGQSSKDSILNFIKVFDRFSAIKEAEITAKMADEKFKTFNKAQKLSLITNIGKREFETNERIIKNLKDEVSSLSNDLENNLLDIDSETSSRIIELKSNLSKFRKQRYFLINKIKQLSDNENYSFSKTTKDFEILQSFFPNIELKRIEDIETFHKNISKIFIKHSSDERKKAEKQLEEINHAIYDSEREISNLSNCPKLSTVVLEKHANIMKQINEIEQKNKSYMERFDLKRAKDDATVSLLEIKTEQLKDIQNCLNQKMHEINTFIYGGSVCSPKIEFNSNNYVFYTPNDTGTGTAHKGLIVFDLAVSELTKVPVLIHDSILLKQISNEILTKILVKYSMSSKQLFIAFDKQNTYGQKALSLIDSNCVIKLSHDGNELFGKYWASNF